MISKKIQTPALDSYYYGVAAVFSCFKSTQLVETTTKLNLIKNIFILIYNFLHFKKTISCQTRDYTWLPVREENNLPYCIFVLYFCHYYYYTYYYYHFCLFPSFSVLSSHATKYKTIFLSDFACGTLGT